MRSIPRRDNLTDFEFSESLGKKPLAINSHYIITPDSCLPKKDYRSQLIFFEFRFNYIDHVACQYSSAVISRAQLFEKPWPFNKANPRLQKLTKGASDENAGVRVDSNSFAERKPSFFPYLF